MKNYLISLLLLLTIKIFSQDKIAEYSKLQNNFFSRYKKPISIVIFPFYFRDAETYYSDKLYNKLTSAFGKQSNFLFNFYRNLGSLINKWGFKEWDITNQKLLKKLNDDLEIKLIAYGILANKDANSFSFIILNIETGKIEFNSKYFLSSNSDPISDIVKLFTEYKITIYNSNEIEDKDLITEEGTLIINTITEGTFQIFLNDRFVGVTPYTDSLLKMGSYNLTIKDPKEEYESYVDTFEFNPKINQVLSFRIKLHHKSKNVVSDENYPNTNVPNKKTNQNQNPSEENRASLSTSNPEYINKTQYTILGFSSFPQGDFKSTNITEKSGYAKQGFGGAIEFDIPINRYINWMISPLFSTHPINKEALGLKDSKSYITCWLMFGSRIKFPISRSNECYMLGQIGFLVSKFPELYSELKSNLALSWAYGIGAGIKLNVFDFGLRYYYGEPEYKLEYFNQEIKLKSPSSVLLFTFGFRM